MKKHEKWIMGVLLLISLSCSYIAIGIRFPRCENLGLDYMGIIVGILSLLVTVLLSWSIFQVIDLKSYKDKIDKEMNYIRNNADYNQALIYGMLSQNASMYFAPNEDKVMKYQMLLKGLTALKILSNLPNCGKEIDSISKTMIKGLNNSTSIKFTDKEKTNLILMCGEIVHKDRISNYDDIIELLKVS